MTSEVTSGPCKNINNVLNVLIFSPGAGTSTKGRGTDLSGFLDGKCLFLDYHELNQQVLKRTRHSRLRHEKHVYSLKEMKEALYSPLFR